MTATAQSGNTRAFVIVGIIQAVLFCLMQLHEIIGLDEGDEPAGGKDTGIRVNGGHSQNQSTGTTNKKTGMPQIPLAGAPAVKMTTSPPVAQYKGTTPMGMGGMPMGGMPMGGMPMGGMPMGMGGMPMYR